MIQYRIGVDGGGSKTRVRLANYQGALLAHTVAGPSALALGVDAAWRTILTAIDAAFSQAGTSTPPLATIAIGLGLAGVHNAEWARAFTAADPGFGALVLDTDAFTTLLGAHGGAPGAIVAIGTGSVGEALLADGRRIEVGGWGFPAGDEASGAWMGLRALNHLQQVLDARVGGGPLAQALLGACGSERSAVQAWLGRANQTAYASLAPLVLAHGASDPVARAILEQAGEEVASIAAALDASGALPLALCGGLGEALLPWLPPPLRARCQAPQMDAASGALLLLARTPGAQP